MNDCRKRIRKIDKNLVDKAVPGGYTVDIKITGCATGAQQETECFVRIRLCKAFLLYVVDRILNILFGGDRREGVDGTGHGRPVRQVM